MRQTLCTCHVFQRSCELTIITTIITAVWVAPIDDRLAPTTRNPCCGNRRGGCAGVQGTLHRISAIRNRKGTIIGLTCRVGRAVTGHIDMIRDILDSALL